MRLWSLQDIVSEHPERFFVAEIVREKIFLQYRQEIPYACQVCSNHSLLVKFRSVGFWNVLPVMPTLEVFQALY
jgi:hypothetical protein